MWTCMLGTSTHVSVHLALISDLVEHSTAHVICMPSHIVGGSICGNSMSHTPVKNHLSVYRPRFRTGLFRGYELMTSTMHNAKTGNRFIARPKQS